MASVIVMFDHHSVAGTVADIADSVAVGIAGFEAVDNVGSDADYIVDSDTDCIVESDADCIVDSDDDCIVDSGGVGCGCEGASGSHKAIYNASFLGVSDILGYWPCTHLDDEDWRTQCIAVNPIACFFSLLVFDRQDI